jgi:hypothetical protein
MKWLGVLFTCAVIIPGCGTTAYSGDTWIDPELRPLVADWVRDCNKHLNVFRCNTLGIVSIRIVDKFKDDDTLGQCEVGVKDFEEVKYIKILRGFALDTYSAKALMLHEMMHCRMGFTKHVDVGVMGERMGPSEFYYQDNWEKILEETYSLLK